MIGQEPERPAGPRFRWPFICCMAVVAISAVLQLIWAVQRHF